MGMMTVHEQNDGSFHLLHIRNELIAKTIKEGDLFAPSGRCRIEPNIRITVA